jgi:ABC-type nitrate/sulfonate/bicarbonate transport system substrate-binding protein
MMNPSNRRSRFLEAIPSLTFFSRPPAEGKGERTRNSFSLLLIAVALLWMHSLAHAQESRRILYGVSTSISHLPVWVGKDTGLFAKNGLNIEPVQIRGGAVSTMAIMSGQAVLSGVGAGSVVAARVEGGDIV